MKLIWKLSILPLCILACLGLTSYVVFDASFTSMRDLYVRDIAEDRFAHITKNIEARAQESVRQASIFVRLPAVMQAYELALSGNIDDPYSPQSQMARELLRKELAPMLDNYRTETGKKLQLHFHLPNGLSLVRLWRDKNTRIKGEWVDISDDLTSYRATVMDVNRSGKVAVGIEPGSGGFAIRGVIPVKTPDGRQIGSAEVLQDFQTVLDAAMAEGKMYIALYAYKELLAFSVALQNPAQHPHKGNFVRITEANDDSIEAMITPELLAKGKNGTVFDTHGSVTLATFPINDYSGKQVGVLVCAVNAAGVSKFTAIVETAFAFMLAGMLIMPFIARLLGLRILVTGPLNAIKTIIQAIVENRVGLRAQVPDRRTDEIGELARWFNALTAKVGAMLEDLRGKEEALTTLTASLQQEAERRNATLQALKKSAQRFKELADRDPLTNLLNRRAFFSCAEMGMQSAYSLKQPCCVCLLDVDHFKRFNDTFGHQEGDRALQYVTRICKRMLCPADIMGRYGGEEFIIFLPAIGAKQGYAAVERIRQTIEEHPFSLEKGGTTQLTASFGLAVILPDETQNYAETLRLTIHRADAALYEAKAMGRNRISVAPLERENCYQPI